MPDSTAAATVERPHTIDEYKSSAKPTWCPGCGDFGVLNAVYNSLKVKGYNTEDVVVISGIGCSSRFPFFVNAYGFHGVHGRAIPIATGVKVANPDLKVLVVGGDGDAFAIGGGHFVHGMRRNVDVTYVIMDNEIYGLTKGQTSPTSNVGFITKSSPKGSVDQPLNPLALALISGATFVARGFAGKPKELADLIVQGINHPGMALIDVYSPCPTFNEVNTFKFFRDTTKAIPATHSTCDRAAAIELALQDDPLYLGLFYQATESESFDRRVRRLQTANADESAVMDRLFEQFS
jgi:2-oxoglutarate/2-oxoacid ferredoxin oxidoreductase subunit beta